MPLSRLPRGRAPRAPCLSEASPPARLRLFFSPAALVLAACRHTPPTTPVATAGPPASPAGNEVWLPLPPEDALTRLRHPPASGPLKPRPLPPDPAAPGVVGWKLTPPVTAYVDCGTVRVPAPGLAERELPLARDFQQFRQRIRGVDYTVWRSMQLTVLTPIETLPPPDGQSGTRVRLTPRFGLSRERLVTGAEEKPRLSRDTIQFAAGKIAAFAHAPQPCRSTGRLEQELGQLLAALAQAPQPLPGTAAPGKATRRTPRPPLRAARRVADRAPKAPAGPRPRLARLGEQS